jgi:hypothetical protein
MDSLKSTVIVFTRDGMGSVAAQDHELQIKVTGTFLKLIGSSGDLPGAICFYTDGVKLACEGSSLLEELKALETQGVRLIVCKTCLDYFALADKVQVGIVGGMPDIIDAMTKAGKVISI